MTTAAPVLETSHELAPQAVRRAAEVLRDGGLVVFPTETLYGVAAALRSNSGIARLTELKQTGGRAASGGFTIHLPEADAAERYVDFGRSPLLRRLIRKTMPGPVTIIAEVSEDVIEAKLAALGLPPEARRLVYFDHSVSLRCPDHPIASAMLSAMDEPVVAGGASRPGDPPPTDAEVARRLVGDAVDLILDGGPTRFSRPSAIIRVSGQGATVQRGGIIDQRYLDKLMKQTIVFVCSGNTCRSPMSEAIARDELARRQTADPNVQVLSAGIFATAGAPITPEAEQALRKLGIEVHEHSSRPLTTSLADQADAIYCMTENHLAAVREIAPAAAFKAQLLDPAGEGVEDPIGATADVYVKCAHSLQHMIRRRLDELGFAAAASK